MNRLYFFIRLNFQEINPIGMVVNIDIKLRRTHPKFLYHLPIGIDKFHFFYDVKFVIFLCLNIDSAPRWIRIYLDVFLLFHFIEGMKKCEMV